MKIEFAASFLKSYKKRIANKVILVKRTKERIEMFRHDKNHPLLKDHPLLGSRHTLRSFSIAGDIRIVYQLISSDRIRFVDIGSHNQVY